MGDLQTEFSFTLPKGYVDKGGTLHRRGTMRLATARDEIEPLRDTRISSPDDPFLTVIVLSRVVTELGTLSMVTPNDIQELFAADLAYLQDFYGIINFGSPEEIAALQARERDARRGGGDPAPAPETGVSESTGDGADAPSPRRARVEEVPSSTGT